MTEKSKIERIAEALELAVQARLKRPPTPGIRIETRGQEAAQRVSRKPGSAGAKKRQVKSRLVHAALAPPQKGAILSISAPTKAISASNPPTINQEDVAH